MFNVCQKYLLMELVSLFQLNAHNCPVTLFSAVSLSMQLWYKQRQKAWWCSQGTAGSYEYR